MSRCMLGSCTNTAMFHTRSWGPDGVEHYRAVCAEEYGTYMDANTAAKFGVWSEAISAREAEGGPVTHVEGAFWGRALSHVELNQLYNYGKGVFYDTAIAAHLLNFTDTPFTAKSVPIPINIEMKWTWL